MNLTDFVECVSPTDQFESKLFALNSRVAYCVQKPDSLQGKLKTNSSSAFTIFHSPLAHTPLTNTSAICSAFFLCCLLSFTNDSKLTTTPLHQESTLILLTHITFFNTQIYRMASLATSRELSLKPEVFSWADEMMENMPSSVDAIAFTPIPWTAKDDLEEYSEFVVLPVAKSTLDMIKSEIGLSIIKNVEGPSYQRQLPDSFTERRSFIIPIIEDPALQSFEPIPKKVYQKKDTVPHAACPTYEEGTADDPNASSRGNPDTTKDANDRFVNANDNIIGNPVSGDPTATKSNIRESTDSSTEKEDFTKLIERLRKETKVQRNSSKLNLQFQIAKMASEQRSKQHSFEPNRGLAVIKIMYHAAIHGGPNSGKSADSSLDLSLSLFLQDPAIIRYSVRKPSFVDPAIISAVIAEPKNFASIRRSANRLDPNAPNFVPRRLELKRHSNSYWGCHPPCGTTRFEVFGSHL